MITIIKNKEDLLSHGNRDGRRIALNIIESALRKIDTYKAVRKKVLIRNVSLLIDSLKWDLSKIQKIYVVGAGKGSIGIAEALEDILGKRIEKGLIIEKRGQGRKLKTIRVLEGGHPIPDEAGLRGAKEIIKIAKSAKEGDLVFVAITGGCSALMPLPAKGISLEDKKRVNDLLLKCGSTIEEINAVRKHISAVKGGRLAKYIYPAEIVNLIVVDEVACLPWGPTISDTTTFGDAVRILKKYDLWKKIPVSIRKHLKMGLANPSLETPKSKDFEKIKVHNIILADNSTACEAAKERAEKLGFNSAILSTVMEGESKEAGIVLASIAKEIEKNRRPFKPPCVLIVGGETTVTIEGETGEGGRNQELTLSSSLKIDGIKNIVISAVGTDGTDGSTEIAGAIADGYTVKRAKERGIDIYENLIRHNSSYVFRELRDTIITGPTGTNVMDLTVIVITNSLHLN